MSEGTKGGCPRGLNGFFGVAKVTWFLLEREMVLKNYKIGKIHKFTKFYFYFYFYTTRRFAYGTASSGAESIMVNFIKHFYKYC